MEREGDTYGTYGTGLFLNLLGTANEALWLAQPSNIWFDVVACATQVGGAWQQVEYVYARPLVAHPRGFPKQQTVETLTEAKAIFSTLLALQGGQKGSVAVAVQTLWLALVERWYEMRYALLWIVLESIFGPGSPGETTYRLSQRIAFFLARSSAEAETLFKQVKDAYAIRSRVVHGMRGVKVASRDEQKKFLVSLYEMEAIVRAALLRLHHDPTVLTSLNGNGREQHLDGLLFRPEWAPEAEPGRRPVDTRSMSTEHRPTDPDPGFFAALLTHFVHLDSVMWSRV
ncbi:MAG: hypothetical protein HY650_01280 [Acidobacteria bacterium]|nr:hypothetical protein [Acidobacteriota bacterium]